jgi:probable rRNA maturation factor
LDKEFDMPITFQNADVDFLLKHKKKLLAFIARQLKENGFRAFTLSYIFCSDDYLLDMNRKFLGHDYYTDIITFPLKEDIGKLEAEIYISIERVKENAETLAKQSGQTAKQINSAQIFENELNRVMFHGILHLLGHKDKTKAQKLQMRKREEEWLQFFGK